MENEKRKMGLFGKFNRQCSWLLLWCESRAAALLVMFVVALLVAATLESIYGDNRACIRRNVPTYVNTGTTMTPIPGDCLEYSE